MKFDIDDTQIDESFDAIAKELINEHVLLVNDQEFNITEIEFYYFNTGHEDIYTHRHLRRAGEWRIHNQGIDITLEGNNDKDGGILIRGLKYNKVGSDGLAKVTYINGPIKALGALFESMGSVVNSSSILLSKKNPANNKIIKTFRHIPNKIQNKDFHFKKYRYLTDLEHLDISNPIKNQIKNDCIEV
jgi:hypothetical protein